MTKIMHKVWSGIKEVLYCLHMSNVVCHTVRIERFRAVTLVRIHRWLRNNAPNLIGINEIPHYFSKSPVIFQVQQGHKFYDLALIWAFISGWQLQFEFVDIYEIAHIVFQERGRDSLWYFSQGSTVIYICLLPCKIHNINISIYIIKHNVKNRARQEYSIRLMNGRCSREYFKAENANIHPPPTPPTP